MRRVGDGRREAGAAYGAVDKNRARDEAPSRQSLRSGPRLGAMHASRTPELPATATFTAGDGPAMHRDAQPHNRTA